MLPECSCPYFLPNVVHGQSRCGACFRASDCGLQPKVKANVWPVAKITVKERNCEIAKTSKREPIHDW